MTICSLGKDLPTQKPDFINIVNALSKDNFITFENEQIEIAHNTFRDFTLRELKNKEEAEEITKRYINYYDSLVTKFMRAKHKEKKDPEQLKEYLNLFEGQWENLYDILETIINIRNEYIYNEMIRLLSEEKYREYWFCNYKSIDEYEDDLFELTREEAEKINLSLSFDEIKEIEEIVMKIKVNAPYPSVAIWQSFWVGDIQNFFNDDWKWEKELKLERE